jgi:hypothetical protein
MKTNSITIENFENDSVEIFDFIDQKPEIAKKMIDKHDSLMQVRIN